MEKLFFAHKQKSCVVCPGFASAKKSPEGGFGIVLIKRHNVAAKNVKRWKLKRVNWTWPECLRWSILSASVIWARMGRERHQPDEGGAERQINPWLRKQKVELNLFAQAEKSFWLGKDSVVSTVYEPTWPVATLLDYPLQCHQQESNMISIALLEIHPRLSSDWIACLFV